MKTKKHDFIELDFIANVKNGGVFDTTLKEEAKGISGTEQNFKPAKVCIGEGMVIKGFDEALENKEPGEYVVEIKPEKAFGLRNSKLFRTLPLSVFKEVPQINSYVNVDGIIARVVNISSGRALLDFNHPLAGKELVYKFWIKRIITSDVEKAEVLGNVFGLKLKTDEGKIIIEEGNKTLIEAFEKKLADLGIKVQVVLEKNKKNNQKT